jgi:hypothetical protein
MLKYYLDEFNLASNCRFVDVPATGAGSKQALEVSIVKDSIETAGLDAVQDIQIDFKELKISRKEARSTRFSPYFLHKTPTKKPSSHINPNHLRSQAKRELLEMEAFLWTSDIYYVTKYASALFQNKL